MQWFFRVIAGLVILWTLVPLVRHGAWWIRVFDFPRVQIAIAAALLLAWFLVSGYSGGIDTALAAALLGCLVYQLVRIWPYTRLHSKQLLDATDARGQEQISVMVANVLTPNRNAARLRGFVERWEPDLLLCVETDRWWEAALEPLEARYPYTVKRPQDNLYGMHLYSKRPLHDMKVKFLLDEAVPSIHGWVELSSGRRVRIHAVHPTPPAPTENPRSDERDAELLLVARAVEKQPAPTLVFGDLNDVAWSATNVLFQRISGLLDPRIGRGMFSTFHAKYPFLRWPLDHIFISSEFTLAVLERLPAFGSDHLPIYARLVLAPEAEAVHEEPEADDADRRDAAERIEKTGARESV